MEFSQLSARARQIRVAFASHASRQGRAWTREEIMQGFVGDVGDLMKLVMAKAGTRPVAGDLDAKLAHELSDCLWSILVLADAYGCDLEQEFLKTMSGLEVKLRPPGRARVGRRRRSPARRAGRRSR